MREAPPSLGGRLPLGYSQFCSRDDRSIRSRNIVYEVAEATTIVRTLRPDVEDALDQWHAPGVLGHRDATVARRLHSARRRDMRRWRMTAEYTGAARIALQNKADDPTP